jgi:hypothetical protein
MTKALQGGLFVALLAASVVFGAPRAHAQSGLVQFNGEGGSVFVASSAVRVVQQANNGESALSLANGSTITVKEGASSAVKKLSVGGFFELRASGGPVFVLRSFVLALVNTPTHTCDLVLAQGKNLSTIETCAEVQRKLSVN